MGEPCRSGACWMRVAERHAQYQLRVCIHFWMLVVMPWEYRIFDTPVKRTNSQCPISFVSRSIPFRWDE